MSGNATFTYSDTAILAVTAAVAPIVVTSDEIDAQLMQTYDRVGLAPGMLEPGVFPGLPAVDST